MNSSASIKAGNFYYIGVKFPSDGLVSSIFHNGNSTSHTLNIRYETKNAIWTRVVYPGEESIEPQRAKGDFIEYIYSTSSNAYPQDGVSGNYWYSDRTAITVSPPSSISVSPNPPKGGSNVSVSWGAASSGGGAISNYELSKRLDGGGWTVVGTYGGSTRTDSVPVAKGTETIAFRVRAKDENGYWSDYKTSGAYTVKNNAAPGAPGSITVPETVYGGKETEISWAAASDPDGNLSGYILERQTDGGSWSQRYKGAGLSYADTVPFGTASVCYRVKAYDAENLSSGYTTSPTRSVVNAPDVPVLTVPELAMEGQTVPCELDGRHPRRRLHAGAQGQHGRRLDPGVLRAGPELQRDRRGLELGAVPGQGHGGGGGFRLGDFWGDPGGVGLGPGDLRPGRGPGDAGQRCALFRELGHGEPDLPGAAGQRGPVDRPGGVQRLRPEHPGHRPAHRRGDH